nr:hypothetical protein I308_05199 [Cryptococcus tetragattii IND107]
MSHLKPVTISYSALAFDGKKEDLQQQVFHALGTHKGALGIVLISGKYSTFDEGDNELINVCRSSSSIPLSSRETLPISSPSCKYARKRTGKARKARNVLHVWLVPWQGDHEWNIQKGSYYANPLMDYPIVSDETRLAYPEYYAGNIWPKGMSGLEDFEQTFKELGKLIFDVGVLLARVCDNFVTPTLANPEGTLSSLIAKSKSSKARLLHYYPEDPNLPIDDNMFNDALCGTHLDHSLLTGLCKLSTTSLSTWSYRQSLMP